MPLPPALAAKLAKRGLIKGTNGQPAQESTDKIQEEIIAEDYDDTPQQTELIPKQQVVEVFDKFQGWYACPNKWNVYHDCSQACRKQWKDAIEINSSYVKARLKLLQKYPLPGHWMEVLEPGLGKYYYWNTDTDMVSWLPPGHPKCQVSRAAAVLRKQMLTDRETRLMEEESKLKDDGKGSEYEDSSDDERGRSKIRKKSVEDSSDSSDESEDERELKERRSRPKPERRARELDDRNKNRRGKKRTHDDKLDPMDPAAYSDCPRGTWSSGLQQKDEAKTGVDTTAGGPLFQMRPYPNPGSILRANKNVGPNKQ